MAIEPRLRQAKADDPSVAHLLEKLHFSVTAREIVPDETIQIQNVLIRLAREVRLIVTTGGTGIAPRDVTPEATAAVCERILDGVAECMRAEGSKKTAFAALSRGICGVRGNALILNLPGSPAGRSRHGRRLKTTSTSIRARHAPTSA